MSLSAVYQVYFWPLVLHCRSSVDIKPANLSNVTNSSCHLLLFISSYSGSSSLRHVKIN